MNRHITKKMLQIQKRSRIWVKLTHSKEKLLDLASRHPWALEATQQE